MKYLFGLLVLALLCVGSRSDGASATYGQSVKDFGAKGDGRSDDTEAFRAALRQLKKTSMFNSNATNTTPRGLGKLVVPRGIYRITECIDFTNCNGLVLQGEGREASMLVFTGSDPCMFRLSQVINVSFKELSVIRGTPARAKSREKQTVIQDLNNKVTAFDWNGKGGDRFVKFEDIEVEGFDIVWEIGRANGDNTHSEVYYENCVITNCNRALVVDNAQSVNHLFSSCHFENIDSVVFDFIRGGYLTVIGGSIINRGDLLRLHNVGGIGRNNNHYYFQSCKVEMYRNRDPSAVPRIVNCLGPVSARVTFRNLNNLPASKDNLTYFRVKGQVMLKFEDSSVAGVIDARGNSHEVIFEDSDHRGTILTE